MVDDLHAGTDTGAYGTVAERSSTASATDDDQLDVGMRRLEDGEGVNRDIEALLVVKTPDGQHMSPAERGVEGTLVRPDPVPDDTDTAGAPGNGRAHRGNAALR